MKTLRPLFGFAAITAVAGSVTAFLALSPIPRLMAALLLAASLAATIAGLVALRRRRHERLFIRQSIRAYAPYVLVAVVLLAGLRMWLILMPPKPTPLLRLPPGEQETRLAADITRLEKCGADEMASRPARRSTTTTRASRTSTSSRNPSFMPRLSPSVTRPFSSASRSPRKLQVQRPPRRRVTLQTQ